MDQQELLLNSARAALRRLDDHEHPSTRPLKVTVCPDQHQVAIKISDVGGGIPHGSSDRVWSYLPRKMTEVMFQRSLEGGAHHSTSTSMERYPKVWKLEAELRRPSQ